MNEFSYQRKKKETHLNRQCWNAIGDVSALQHEFNWCSLMWLIFRWIWSAISLAVNDMRRVHGLRSPHNCCAMWLITIRRFIRKFQFHFYRILFTKSKRRRDRLATMKKKVENNRNQYSQPILATNVRTDGINKQTKCVWHIFVSRIIETIQ